jgi:hypothetical protein
MIESEYNPKIMESLFISVSMTIKVVWEIIFNNLLLVSSYPLYQLSVQISRFLHLWVFEKGEEDVA